MFSGRTDYINGDRATVKSPEDVMRIFYTGAFHRTTGETKMNNVWSRSNALLTHKVIKQKVRAINLYFSVPPFLFSVLLSFVSFRGKSYSCAKMLWKCWRQGFFVQQINGVVLAAIETRWIRSEKGKKNFFCLSNWQYIFYFLNRT